MRTSAPRSEFIAAEELARAIGRAAPIVGRTFHVPAPRRAAKPAPSGARRSIGAAMLAILSATVLVL